MEEHVNRRVTTDARPVHPSLHLPPFLSLSRVHLIISMWLAFLIASELPARPWNADDPTITQLVCRPEEQK